MKKKPVYTEEGMAKVFKEIQASVPLSLLSRAVKEVPVYSNLKFVIKKAIADPDFPADKKKDLQVLLDSGDLDKTMPVEDKRYTRLIDKEVTRKINAAIKSGRLPPRSKIKDLPFIKEMYERVKNQPSDTKEN